MKSRSLSLTFLLLSVVSAGAQSAKSERPAVAYSRHGVLTLTTSSGRVLRSLRPSVPVGSFAISADGVKVVYAPLKPKTLGGPLYLLNTTTKKIQRLTRGPYFNKHSQTEVYSDPDLSPSGEEAVFAIHAQAAGDAVETAGPAAIVDLKTRKIRLLKITTDLGGQGAAFANNPRWSPDGSRIVVNFETDAAIVDVGGTKLEDLSGLMDAPLSYVLGWLGPRCLIYVGGKDPEDAERNPARVLNLKTKKGESLSAVLHVPDKSAIGLAAVLPSIRIRRDGKQLVVEGAHTSWTIPYDDTTFVRLVPNKQELSRTPASCSSR